MHPVTSSQTILLIHRERVDAALGRQRRGREATPGPTSRGIRVRLGSALVAVGMRIDPTPSRK